MGEIGPRERLHRCDQRVRAELTRCGRSRRGDLRDLLQEDDAGDAEGEPLDHRPGDDRDDLPQPQQTGHGHDQSREQGDGGDRPDPVGRDDRHEHHDHRAGRAGDLHVRAAEHGCEQAGDDRGDQSLLGGEPGADAEAERERQGDDAHGHARDEVLPPGPRQQAVVLAGGPQAARAGDGRAGALCERRRRGDGRRIGRRGSGGGAHPSLLPSASPSVRASALPSAPGIAGRPSASLSRSRSSLSIVSSRARATASSSRIRGSASR